MEADVQFQCATRIIIARGSSRLLQFSNDIIPSSYILRVIIILSFFPSREKQTALVATQLCTDGNETSVPRKEDPLKSNKVYAHEQFNDGKLYRTE